MSTDLRHALRDAVTDAPSHRVDPQAVIDAGRRRIRRRSAVAVSSCALAVAAVVAATAVAGQDRPDPDPAPSQIDHLDLDDATTVDLDVIASTRTAWDKDRDSLDYDELVGITTDGLVLRNRHTLERGEVELGLLDPRSGRTDWLPTPPGRPFEAVPLDMTAERLVLVHTAGNRHSVLVFDRASRQWRREVVEIPHGFEVHVPPLLELSTDDRVYVGTTLEAQSSPLHWWSAPVGDGGPARSEAALEGVAVTWGGGVRLTSDSGGRVALTGPTGTRVVADRRPAGCERPTDFRDAPPAVLLAGDVPIVTYRCNAGPMAVVFRAGEDPVAVRGVSALAGDSEHVVLATSDTFLGAVITPPDAPTHTYLLDLADLSVSRVGRGPHETDIALAAGLLLWNTPGPGDSQDAYDVVWNVARLD